MSSTTPILAREPADSEGPAARAEFWSRGLAALYSLLLLSLLARLVFTIWEPPFDGLLQYDVIRPLGDAFWPMHLYLGGPAYLVTFVTAAAFVVLLARGRTAALNLVAAALIGLGGTLFSLAITAEALPFALAADPRVLPETQGRALFDVLNSHTGRWEPAILAGMATVTVGVLLALAAGWASRALPRWFIAIAVAYVVVFVALPPGLVPRPLELVLYLAELAVFATLGWFGLRAARRRLNPTAP